MRAAYVELEPRSSGKRSSDEGPSWTGEVPSGNARPAPQDRTGARHLFHHYCPQGIARTAWKEVGMSLAYVGHLSMVGPVVPQSRQGCAECLPTGSLSSKRFSPVKTGVGATSTKH